MKCVLHAPSSHQASVEFLSEEQSVFVEPTFYHGMKWQDVLYVEYPATDGRKYVLQASPDGKLKLTELKPVESKSEQRRTQPD